MRMLLRLRECEARSNRFLNSIKRRQAIADLRMLLRLRECEARSNRFLNSIKRRQATADLRMIVTIAVAQSTEQSVFYFY